MSMLNSSFYQEPTVRQFSAQGKVILYRIQKWTATQVLALFAWSPLRHRAPSRVLMICRMNQDAWSMPANASPAYTVVVFSLHKNPPDTSKTGNSFAIRTFRYLVSSGKEIPSTKHLLQVTSMATFNQVSQFDTEKICCETQSNFLTRPGWPLPPLQGHVSGVHSSHRPDETP